MFGESFHKFGVETFPARVGGFRRGVLHNYDYLVSFASAKRQTT